MKTYQTTVEKNKLEIYHSDEESPREWGNLGYFITVDSRSYSPDKNEQLEEIVRRSGDEAQNQLDHIQIMTDLINTETSEQVLVIYPVVKYEHSGVSYKLGTAHGFDYSNNGFYIVTDKTQKELGTPKKSFEKVIAQELELYNKWVNGEVYGFSLYDDNGDLVDSCGDFYDLEDMRENLPKEWAKEDLEKYIIG
jgi:hypothetical protein